MRVFVAGATGVVGRVLVPDLVERGHEVLALARSAEKARALEAIGAQVACADAHKSGSKRTRRVTKPHPKRGSNDNCRKLWLKF